MKYEKTLVEYKIKADDISLYPQKAMPGFITYGLDEKEEKKQLPIKIRLVRTDEEEGFIERDFQIVLELCGDYHIEKLNCYTEHPSKWNSYGKIHLDLQNTIDLRDRLDAIIKETKTAKQC